MMRWVRATQLVPGIAFRRLGRRKAPSDDGGRTLGFRLHSWGATGRSLPLRYINRSKAERGQFQAGLLAAVVPYAMDRLG